MLFFHACLNLQSQEITTFYTVRASRPSRLANRLLGVVSPYVSRGRDDSFGNEGPAWTNLARPGSILPSSVRMAVEDSKGQLVFSGRQTDVAEAVKWASSMDQQRRKAHFVITIESPMDHYANTTVTDVENNEKWGFKDSVLGCEVAVLPRINLNGSVTCFFFAHVNTPGTDSAAQCVMRLDKGKPERLTFGRTPGHSEWALRSVGKSRAGLGLPVEDDDDPVYVTLRAQAD